MFRSAEPTIGSETQRRPGPVSNRSNVVPMNHFTRCGWNRVCATQPATRALSGRPARDRSTHGFVRSFRGRGGSWEQARAFSQPGIATPTGGVWFAGPSGLGHLEREVASSRIHLPATARGWTTRRRLVTTRRQWISWFRKEVHGSSRARSSVQIRKWAVVCPGRSTQGAGQIVVRAAAQGSP